MTRIFSLLLFVAFASVAQAQDPISSRIYTDDLNQGGRFYEMHTIDLEPGDVVTIVMESTDFDPLLYVKSPIETWENNDDCTAGDITKSCLEYEAEVFGTHEIWAMTFERGAYGDYTIQITKQD